MKSIIRFPGFLIGPSSLLPAQQKQEVEKTPQRAIHDGDGDGWCDLWGDLFSEVDLSKPNEDTDGDGISNF